MIFRDFEQKIVQIINESGMSIDAVYYIMKSIMAEIEQKYFEYCRAEDAAKHNTDMWNKMMSDETGAEATQRALESDQTNEKPVTANNNEEQEEGAN